jgi:tetratricopeptide (TPR) repeat protein
MSFRITAYRIFIASPGGLREEREAFRATVYDYNETDAIQRGVLFIPTGWEDTLSGAGRPQGIINQDLTNCDYFVLVVWDRWGSPPAVSGAGAFTSGTEEEFHVAERCLNDPNESMLQMVILFKAVPPERRADPGEQLSKVLAFRREREIKKDYLISDFDDISRFQSLLRKHLAQWIRNHEQKLTKKPRTIARRKADAAPALTPVNPSTQVRASVPEPERNPLLLKAEQLADSGNLTDAENAFARAAINSKDGDALNSYGSFLQRVGRLFQVREIYEQVVKMGSEIDEKWKSIAFGNLGQLYRTLGDLERAEEMHKKALAMDERLGRKEGMAVQYGKLGRIYRRWDHLDQAEEAHRKALSLNLETKNLAGTAVDYGDLAQVHRRKGDLDTALHYLQQALQINESLHQELGIAIVCGNLGIIYRLKGNPDAADEMHRRSLAIDRRLGNLEGEAIQCGNIGLLYLTRGKLDEAETWLNKSLALNERLGRIEGIAGDQRDLGLVYNARGDTSLARSFWVMARGRFLSMGMKYKVRELDAYLNPSTSKATGAGKQSCEPHS